MSTPSRNTWVIGDVHGCLRELEELYDQLDFHLSRDSLWLAGDLVNRGPESADVLRWCRERERELGARFQCVLGNHDLHAIAVHLGVGRLRRRDTLEDLLEANDRDELCDWLLRRPFIVERDGTLLVHAGVLPEWSPEDALLLGAKLQRRLLEDPEGVIREEMGRSKRRALSAFTRMRTLNADGKHGDYSGPLDDIPQGYFPWFRAADRQTAAVPIVCGHWAALGLHREANVTCLDTACVWGDALTACRLEDGTVVQEPSRQCAC